MSEQLPERVSPARPEVRVGDADRERTVALLRRHCADGFITLDEFSERVGLAWSATSEAQLALVTEDLPAVAPAASPAEPRDTQPGHAVRWTVSIFSGNSRKGRWRVSGTTNAVSVMGGCHIDLRQAEVIGGEVVINAVAVMGGVHVIVPEGIEVDLGGLAVMGGKQARIRDVPVLPGSPLVRVRALAVMGGVTVESRPAPTGRRRRGRHGRAGGAGDGAGGTEERPPRRGRGIEAVADEVRDRWPAVRHQVAPEGTVSILFSDIEAFTSLTEQLGDIAAQAVLAEHYRIVREELARHRGFEVKVHGDGFMVAFDSAARAVRCAKAIQRAQDEWSAAHPEAPVRVRIGIHTGEAIRDADDFLGSAVNVAARIADAAAGGEILVSGLLRELCATTGEFSFENGRELELRGLSQRYHVFSVPWS